MIIIENIKYRDNHCSSCHDKKSKVFDLRIKHDDCSSTVVTLCRKCLEELKQKIERIEDETKN